MYSKINREIKNTKATKAEVISSLFWRFAERCGAQGVSFFVTLILARLLTPDDYGTVALVTVFNMILQVFVDSGMGAALVQKRDADDTDFSSVFYFNCIVCVIIYFVVFLAAPLVANFYQKPELVMIIRVLSLTIVISGLRNVQEAFVSRGLIFKKFFFSTMGSTFLSAVVGIAMAYLGFGVWALVVQQLVNTVTGTAVLWITVAWHPKLLFSIDRLKKLFLFGWKLLVSALLSTIYDSLYQLIIGKIYTASDLAYYTQGKKFPEVIITNIDTSINSVLLPAMSREQDDKVRIRSMTRRAIKTSSFIMWPMMIGLIAIADPLISLILTDKWLSVVPFLRIFCLCYAIWPIHTANLNAINAMGRSDIFLTLEILKKIVGVAVLLATMWYGVLAMAWSMLFMGIIGLIINSYPNKQLLNYSYIEQIRDISPYILVSAVMGFIIYPIQILQLGNLITLFIQIPFGIVIYGFLSRGFKLDSYLYIEESIRNFLNR
jgi:O-antigen/teichoic acid export membrane protein